VAEQSTNKVYILKIGVLGLVIAAYYYIPGIQDFITTGLHYLQYRNFEGLRQFILSYGLWAPVTSIALMTLQSLVPFVPGLAITITNSWIFGWQYGAVYSWIGALLGAILDFGMARWYGRPIFERLAGTVYLNRVDNFLKRHGVLAVFITRLIPLVPFKIVSYGAGLTAISLGHFSIATGIGQSPAIIIYSILGQDLIHSLHATIAITSLLIISGVLVYYYRDVIERCLFSNKEE
jgi:uncharacterized membrane protein YdjX (TVP38/TMEM64 family)